MLSLRSDKRLTVLRSLMASPLVIGLFHVEHSEARPRSLSLCPFPYAWFFGNGGFV